MNDVCELYQMIPKSELDRVFEGKASAELGRDFLCFEEPYKLASMIVPKTWTIVDLGCAYAAQAYYFAEHLKYIGVDCFTEKDMIRFRTDNMELYEMTIREYVRDHIKKLDFEHTFAICSAVPDRQAQKLTLFQFPNHYVWYPGGKTDLRLEVKG